jgi:serine/threonine protein kinase
LCPACLLGSGLADQVLAAPVVRARVLTLLGQGPSTLAYLAEDTDDPSILLVLKRMTPSSAVRDVVARVDALRTRIVPCIHRHIARVIDLGADRRDVFSITEFWPGIPITRFVERSGAQDAGVLWSHARSALESAHAAGIVHGAVKPSNLLIARTARGPVLKILDFGHEHLLGRRPAASIDAADDLRALEGLRAKSGSM